MTVKNLTGFTGRDIIEAEKIIDTARSVGREQNRLMKKLSRESRQQIQRVLDEENSAQLLPISQYLQRVKFLVSVEKTISEKIESEEKTNKGDLEIKRDLLEYLNSTEQNFKQAGYKLLYEPLPAGEADSTSVASDEYASASSGKVTWAKNNQIYQLVTRHMPKLNDEEVQETLNAVADRMTKSGNNLLKVQQDLQEELRTNRKNEPLGNQLTFVNLLVRNHSIETNFKAQIIASK